jgi:hypothetical protein
MQKILKMSNMKITKKSLVRWKVYLDRSRVYVASAQFIFIGVILARSFGWDVSLLGAVIMTIVFAGIAMTVGYFDTKLGIRSEEFRNLSESNPLMMEILNRLEVIQPRKKGLDLSHKGMSDRIMQAGHMNISGKLVFFTHEGLKTQREILGLTLRQVASMTGISSSTVSRIEQGKECKLSNINKLIQFYDGRSKESGQSAGGNAPELPLFSGDRDDSSGSGSQSVDLGSAEAGQDNKTDQEAHEEEVQHHNQGGE